MHRMTQATNSPVVDDMDWDDRRIERLRAYWLEGLPTSEIARRMNTSKSSVVGKAHRLGLTARPSPIRASGVAKPRRDHPSTGLAVLSDIPVLGAPRGGYGSARAASPPIAEPAFLPRKPVQCCWLLGERRSFLFCESPSLPGKSYCEQHAQRAYTKAHQ